MIQEFRQYLSDDDSISYENTQAEDKSVARTVISESCKTVFENLNKKYPSVPFNPPTDIVLENSSDNALENDDEYDEFVTNNDNDVIDDSSDIIETNLSTEEKTFYLANHQLMMIHLISQKLISLSKKKKF